MIVFEAGAESHNGHVVNFFCLVIPHCFSSILGLRKGFLQNNYFCPGKGKHLVVV